MATKLLSFWIITPAKRESTHEPSPDNMLLPWGCAFPTRYLKEYKRRLVFQFVLFQSEAKIANVEGSFLQYAMFLY